MDRCTVAGIIDQYSKRCPEKTALVIGDQSLSYSQLNRRIKAAAYRLSGCGVYRGCHVVSVAEPTFDYVAQMYATLGLGAVHIPVENKIPLERLAEISAAVDAEFVISDEKPNCGCVWIPRNEPGDNDEIDPSFAWNPVSVSDECSEIVFTTGTTGKSKGVMLSSKCLETYLSVMNPSFGLTQDSVFLLTTSLNHVGGMHRIHQCMAAGCTIIIMEGIRDLKKFFRYIDDYGVTHTYLPPASVKLLITLAKKEMARLDGKLQFIYTASAPFPVSDIETLMAIMPHTHLHQGYGSSETGSICNCRYNAPGETPDCLGQPYPCVEVILQDADGNPVEEAYKEGYIRSRSGMNMLGYYKEPALTEKTLRDGFVYSSDLMFFDDRGNLHFAGRGDDVINVKGFKIAPTEIESCVLKHPAVFDCVCIPYNDKLVGCTIKLLVCLREGVRLEQEDIINYLSAKLEPYKLPKYIEEVQEIPKTPNGKINRKEIIQNYSNME